MDKLALLVVFLLGLTEVTVSAFTPSVGRSLSGAPRVSCAQSVRKVHTDARICRFQSLRCSRLESVSTRPRPGQLKASDLVKYLWNEAQYFPDFPAPSLEFFSDDIVYEDMIYSKPFVGKEAVKAFLLMTKEKAPEDFVFVLDRVSDGERSCGFTWHIELKTRPDAGKFANGCSFYELNSEGRICYIRDIPEPPIKIGSFGLTLARLAAKALKSRPPPAAN